MNFKRIFCGVLFLLSVSFLYAQNSYFFHLPQQQNYEIFKRSLTDNGFDLLLNEGSTYLFSKSETNMTTEVVVVCPPTGWIHDVMYEYSGAGVKSSRAYKQICQAVIAHLGQPHMKTTKEMVWFFPAYSVVVAKDKKSVSLVWTKNDDKK